KTPEVFEAYRAANIPFNRMIAYIGPDVKPGNQEMYRLLNAEGVMCMISAAPTYDKLPTAAQRAEAYRAVFADGASILESDLPIEVAEALVGKTLFHLEKLAVCPQSCLSFILQNLSLVAGERSKRLRFVRYLF